MAIKTFGYTPGTMYSSAWGLTNVVNCVGLRAVMPEDGSIIKIRVKVDRYDSSNVPILWGMVWARTAGTILSKSTHSVSPSKSYTTPGAVEIQTFTMDGAKISKDTPIWIGFGRNSSAGKGFRAAMQDNVGTITDYSSAAATAPANFGSTRLQFTYNSKILNIWVEVTYKTGGEVKVFTGGTWTAKPAKVWSGGAWVTKPVKVWNGSAWVESES